MKTIALNENQLKFLSLLARQGEEDIDSLAAELDLSRQTVYNYLDLLSKSLTFERRSGKIYLYLKDETQSDSFASRLAREKHLKEKVAAHAARNYIAAGEVLFLDCGSTIAFLADAIKDGELADLTILTVNPYVLDKLQPYNKLRELLVFGGTLNGDAGSIAGPWVMILLEKLQYQFKKAFLGIDGLTMDCASGSIRITLSNLMELPQKKKIIETSSEIYVLLDSSKIGGGGVTLLEHKRKTPFPAHMKFILGCTEEDRSRPDIKKLKDVLGEQLEFADDAPKDHRK